MQSQKNLGDKAETSLELSNVENNKVEKTNKNELISEAILTSLDEDKAEDIVCIDLFGKSSIADKMIIASGRSGRHVAALADHISKKLKEDGLARVKVQGLPNADWVLIDAGDVITHIFKPEVRTFYDIERIWKDETAINQFKS